MKAALDVLYDDAKQTARVAAVVFEKWSDSKPIRTYIKDVVVTEPYVPGEFYRRELPCLLAILADIEESVTEIIVDSYVDLADEHPGMGRRLFNALGMIRPIYTVIGVAKTRFKDAPAIEVRRGASESPLFVSSAGFISPAGAASTIAAMDGPFRIPTLLKLADTLTRSK